MSRAAPSPNGIWSSSDYETGEGYIPLKHLTRRQAKFETYDSLLKRVCGDGFRVWL